MGTSSSSRELGLERTLYDGFSLDSLAVFHDPGESRTRSWHDKRKTVVEYLWADGTLLSSTDYYKKESGRYRPVAGRGDRAYYQTDALGTVRAALDSRANVLETWRYDAFGTAYSGNFGDEYRFGYTGKALDSVTGAYDYGFRDYAPTLGRFTTVDPIRDGKNWYAYCGSDPINYVDILGLCSDDESKSTYQLLDGPSSANGTVGDISYSVEFSYPKGINKVYGHIETSGWTDSQTFTLEVFVSNSKGDTWGISDTETGEYGVGVGISVKEGLTIEGAYAEYSIFIEDYGVVGIIVIDN